MKPEDVPTELVTLSVQVLKRQTFDRTDEQVSRAILAAVLPAHEAMVRAQFAEEIRTLAATGTYNADEYGSHRNILELADDLARGDR